MYNISFKKRWSYFWSFENVLDVISCNRVEISFVVPFQDATKKTQYFGFYLPWTDRQVQQALRTGSLKFRITIFLSNLQKFHKNFDTLQIYDLISALLI